MPVEPSAFALLHRRSLFAAVLALAACDSDTTPIVESVPAGGGARLASANATDRGAALSDREPDYKLGPNDKVRIIVFGQPTLTGEFSLDGNGVLAFADRQRFGQRHYYHRAAEGDRRQLDPGYLVNPSVSAEVITRRPFYVIGEVHKPGNYPYVTDMTALNAVAMAGGSTYRGRKNDFYIKRLDKNGRMVRIVANAGTVLQPSDTLEVANGCFDERCAE